MLNHQINMYIVLTNEKERQYNREVSKNKAGEGAEDTFTGGASKSWTTYSPLFYPKGIGKMSQTIGTDGIIRHRTKPMPLERAAAFARCLEANRERFYGVEIVAARTKQEAYFVLFQPVNPERQAELYETEWSSRKRKAEGEGEHYIFWKCSDRKGVWFCFNPLSGETYEVTTFDCSCADYTYRCAAAGLHCKHQHALEIYGGRAEKQTESREERDARIRRNINLDF